MFNVCFKWFNNNPFFHQKHISRCYIFRYTYTAYVIIIIDTCRIIDDCIVHIIIIIISNMMFIIVTNIRQSTSACYLNNKSVSIRYLFVRLSVSRTNLTANKKN